MYRFVLQYKPTELTCTGFIAINTNRTYMYRFYCNTNQHNLHVQLRNSHAPNILNSLLFSGFGNFSANLRKAPQNLWMISNIGPHLRKTSATRDQTTKQVRACALSHSGWAISRADVWVVWPRLSRKFCGDARVHINIVMQKCYNFLQPKNYQTNAILCDFEAV